MNENEQFTQKILCAFAANDLKKKTSGVGFSKFAFSTHRPPFSTKLGGMIYIHMAVSKVFEIYKCNTVFDVKNRKM